ncbi:DUF5658 family protein [Chloroflexota bacterium]
MPYGLMKYLLGLLAGLVVSDGLLTYFLIENGLAREGNPFLVPIVGESSFLVLKVVGAILCVLILWDIYRRFPKLALIATSCFVVVYGAIVVWNTSLFFIT